MHSGMRLCLYELTLESAPATYGSRLGVVMAYQTLFQLSSAG